MEQKTNRKIVSKGAYVKAQGKRGMLAVFAAILWLVTLFGLWLIGLFFYQIITGLLRSDTMLIAFLPICFIVILATGLLTFVFGMLAKKTTKAVKTIDPGVPLTHAKTADLPAPDSLVRASSKPLQAQKAVLLRAVEQEIDTPPEQLVRAVNGQ